MNIVLLGNGRVATHFARRLSSTGSRIVQLWGRSRTGAELLASEIGCPFTDDLGELPKNADLYLLALADDALPEIAELLAEVLPPDVLIVHTSGTRSGTIFKPHFKKFGVLYPLQSFSLQKTPDFDTLPICLDAADTPTFQKLETFAHTFAKQIYKINDEQRAKLHVAAVFVNNFTNHFYAIAEEMLQRENLSFDILKPLILETALKVQTLAPAQAQTGPAVRLDAETIHSHFNYLETRFPEYAQIYQVLTASIFNKNH